MLRAYRESDLDQLLEAFRNNIPNYFSADEEKDLVGYLAGHGNTYLVIELDGRVVGGCGYVLDDEETGIVAWSFLDPDFAGKGFGRQIVNACLDHLKKIPTVKLLRVNTSQLTDGFFSKFGFKTVYTEKDHWGEGLDLVRMEMPSTSLRPRSG